jgi:23S rRNA pseudouridine1911/1915/1917 synthase
VTRYETIEDFGGLSLLSLRLLTGRTHQARVHLAHIGHPLVGDALYAGGRWRGIADPRRRALAKGFGRPALHAFGLCLRHPISGEELSLHAPLPADFFELLEKLRGAP